MEGDIGEEVIYQRCVQEYQEMVSTNPDIDPGHALPHVKVVYKHSIQACEDLLELDSNVFDSFIKENPRCNLNIPKDIRIRITAASLLHEVGDKKTRKASDLSKEDLIMSTLDRVFAGYTDQPDEAKQDILRMIDLTATSKWGDRIPDGTSLYQLIVRWADRLEATGGIGIVRSLLYTYSNGNLKQPFVLDSDDFPKTINELEQVAPYSRFVDYSNGKPSSSSWGHFLDKIRHISGKDVPIPSLSSKLEEGRELIDRFILSFSSKFDISWIISHLPLNEYLAERTELISMRDNLVASMGDKSPVC